MLLQLREVIANFHGSKYGKCLSLLDEMKDNLMLDMYLAPHVETLYGMIRNRSLVQYFSPYMSADMKIMAQSFNTTVAGNVILCNPNGFRFILSKSNFLVTLELTKPCFSKCKS